MKRVFVIMAAVAMLCSFASCQKDPVDQDVEPEVGGTMVLPSGTFSITKALLCKADFSAMNYAEIQLLNEEAIKVVVGVPAYFWEQTIGLQAVTPEHHNTYLYDVPDNRIAQPANTVVGPGNSLTFSFDTSEMIINLDVDLETSDAVKYKIKYYGPVEFSEVCLD